MGKNHTKRMRHVENRILRERRDGRFKDVEGQGGMIKI